MKIECELIFKKSSTHLSQIISGFLSLEKVGIVKCKFSRKQSSYNSLPNSLDVIINKKYVVRYDVEDWVEDLTSLDEKLNNYDFHFKRSYSATLFSNLKNRDKIFPLGLNYPQISEAAQDNQNHSRSLFNYNSTLKYYIKKILFYKDRSLIPSKHFEGLPFSQNREKKILFITRLWSPDEETVRGEHMHKEREERNKLNKERVSLIQDLKNQYGRRFLGGIIADAYSRQITPSELLLPSFLTNRYKYLEEVKNREICISTTGLHKSIPWKIGEYVAAARAIITEPFHFDLPGQFEVNRNYLQFRSATELTVAIDLLSTNYELLSGMMRNNYIYYHSHLRSDIMIMNTLSIVLDANQDKDTLINKSNLCALPID